MTSENRPSRSAGIQHLRRHIETSLFAAAAAAGGYLLMAIPNLEVFLLILFTAGRTLGLTRGISASFAAALLYFGLNPQGGLFPPLLAAQMIGSAAAPIAGTLLPKRSTGRLWKRAVFPAILGTAVTIWFDLVTNLAYPLSAGFQMRETGAMLIAGIPFAIFHIGSNMVIFYLLAEPLNELVSRRHHSG